MPNRKQRRENHKKYGVPRNKQEWLDTLNLTEDELAIALWVVMMLEDFKMPIEEARKELERVSEVENWSEALKTKVESFIDMCEKNGSKVVN